MDSFERFFFDLLNISITAGWLILAVLILRVVLKKAPKWLFCALWALVGIRLICPFHPESVFSILPTAQTIDPHIVYEWDPAIDCGVAFLNALVNPIIHRLFAPPRDIVTSVNPLQIWLFFTSRLWVLGMAVIWIHTAVNYIRLRLRTRTAILLQDNIRICDTIQTPFILGIIRPRIYLPSNMQEPETGHVLAHEKTHLKRLDHIWKPLGFLILTVYWFSPLCWLAYALFCRDIELACDERVVWDYTLAQKKSYSETLLSLSVPSKKLPSCPLAFGEVGIKTRIGAVLHSKKPTRRMSAAALLFLIAFGICFLTDPAETGGSASSSVTSVSLHDIFFD